MPDWAVFVFLWLSSLGLGFVCGYAVGRSRASQAERLRAEFEFEEEEE